jgi:hypothetical protein
MNMPLLLDCFRHDLGKSFHLAPKCFDSFRIYGPVVRLGKLKPSNNS